MLVFGAGFSIPRVTAAADNSSAVVVAEIIVGTSKHSIFLYSMNITELHGIPDIAGFFF